MDQRAHSNRKLRFQGFCRSIRLIERVFWSFYSTVRSDIQYWLDFSWPYNLLSDKVLRITVYSCANAPAGPDRAPRNRAGAQPCGRRHRGKRCNHAVMLLAAVPMPGSSFRLLHLACQYGGTGWKQVIQQEVT